MMASPLPAGACDCHVHLLGPVARYPFAPSRVYTPGDASEAELGALHARLGIHRVVVVHPSVYGADNRRTVDGLRRLGPRARGVAVIDAATTDADLDALHAAGIRGVRVNIATHGMNDPAEAWRLLLGASSRVCRLAWHVQVLTRPEVVAALASRLPDLPTPLVVDHFGLPNPALGVDQSGFSDLLRLVERGRTLVKLSAIERLTGAGNGAAMAPFIRALVAAGPAGLVWGSDWPHTGGARDPGRPLSQIEPFEPLDDSRAIAVIRDTVADAGLLHQIFVGTPARLYNFAGDATA